MSILFEHHKPGYAHQDPTHVCTCSYCGNQYHKGLHFGLNIPKDWTSWNSWYVIKIWPRMYIRWTNTWLKRFQTNGQAIQVR